MKKNSGYMTRALKAKDPRFARVLERLGYERTDLVSVDSSPKAKKPIKQDERTMLRAEYARVLGKKPFSGWDAATLREKIAIAQEPENDDTPPAPEAA